MVISYVVQWHWLLYKSPDFLGTPCHIPNPLQYPCVCHHPACMMDSMYCSLVVLSGNKYVVLVFLCGGSNRNFFAFTSVVHFLTYL